MRAWRSDHSRWWQHCQTCPLPVALSLPSEGLLGSGPTVPFETRHSSQCWYVPGLFFKVFYTSVLGSFRKDFEITLLKQIPMLNLFVYLFIYLLVGWLVFFTQSLGQVSGLSATCLQGFFPVWAAFEASFCSVVVSKSSFFINFSFSSCRHQKRSFQLYSFK